MYNHRQDNLDALTGGRPRYTFGGNCEMTEEQGKKMGELISKAWSDEAFKARLLSDTMVVLKENGIAVPQGVTVKAVENTSNVFHLVIPPKPTRELSNVELGKVAGGTEDQQGCMCSWHILPFG